MLNGLSEVYCTKHSKNPLVYKGLNWTENKGILNGYKCSSFVYSGVNCTDNLVFVVNFFKICQIIKLCMYVCCQI